LEIVPQDWAMLPVLEPLYRGAGFTVILDHERGHGVIERDL